MLAIFGFEPFPELLQIIENVLNTRISFSMDDWLVSSAEGFRVLIRQATMESLWTSIPQQL